MYSTQLGFFISWFCASYPRKPNYVKIGMELCFILYMLSHFTLERMDNRLIQRLEFTSGQQESVRKQS